MGGKTHSRPLLASLTPLSAFPRTLVPRLEPTSFNESKPEPEAAPGGSLAASNSNKSKGNLKASGKKESNLAASNKGGAASQTANEYDYNFRVVVVGDESVGKSSLILRYTENTFTEEFISSIGADYKTRIVDVRGKKVRLMLFDLAGSAVYRDLTQSHYRGADAVVVVFDLTFADSWKAVPDWRKEVSLHARNLYEVIVGNKSDLESDRLIDHATIDAEDVPYVYASAKSGENVDKLFKDLATTLVDQKNKNRL